MYRTDTSRYYARGPLICKYGGRHLPVRGRQRWQVTLWRQRRSDPGSAHARFRRTLANMTSRRSVVDYGLARRATLASVRSGRTTVTDVCDAHPYLLRAAKFHGEPTEDLCPICRKAKLTHVTYVYGDELGQYEGRVKQSRELAEMAAEYGEFRVYVVEVCQSCGWNHLASSYVLGTGEPAVRRRRRARSSQ
jgi:Family of unknown function (DUF5318)